MNAEWKAAARRHPVYWVSAQVVRGMAKIYFRLSARGVHHVPEVGPVILAVNHVSFADPPWIGCVLPRSIYYLARQTLFSNPLFARLIRWFNAVPVDRDSGGAAGLKTTLERLEAGAGMLMFPEGTRSPDGQLLRARPGIGMAVIKSRAPVVPVRIVGGFEAWGRHSRWPRPRRVTVIFGEPMDFVSLRRESADCGKERLKAIYQEVADDIMRAIAGLEDRAP
jgi:1-acyl-sn-glycerol-3-phosphate acyltransferase